MAYSKSQAKATKKWESQHYEQIKFTAPIGFKDKVKASAEKSGTTMRKFIIEALEDKMGRETK